jgi:hypothetical protein
LRFLKKRSLHQVNEHFLDEHNAAIGRYSQPDYLLASVDWKKDALPKQTCKSSYRRIRSFFIPINPLKQSLVDLRE